MKITIETKRLSSGFGLAAKCALAASVPALTCVLMEADDNGVTLSATDTERTIRVQIGEADVLEHGKVLLPVKLFSKILAANKHVADHIELETDGETLVIRIGSACYRIETNDASTFPGFPTAEPTDYCAMTAQEIVDGYNLTNFSTDTDNARYTLGGVLFERTTEENGKEVYNLVSTDGRRLSRAEMDVTVYGQPNPSESFVIPTRSFALAAQIAKLGASEVQVYQHGGVVYFDYGSVRLSTQLLDGRFPKWGKILPDKNERKCQSFNAETLLTALKQAAVLTSDLCPGVQLHFTEDKLALSVPQATSGKAEILVLPDETADLDATVKIDPSLAMGYLAALPAESVVTIWLKDGQASLLFESPDIDKTIAQYILMPLS